MMMTDDNAHTTHNFFKKNIKNIKHRLKFSTTHAQIYVEKW